MCPVSSDSLWGPSCATKRASISSILLFCVPLDFFVDTSAVGLGVSEGACLLFKPSGNGTTPVNTYLDDNCPRLYDARYLAALHPVHLNEQ